MRNYKNPIAVVKNGLKKNGYATITVLTTPNAVFTFVNNNADKLEIKPFGNGMANVKFKNGFTSL